MEALDLNEDVLTDQFQQNYDVYCFVNLNHNYKVMCM